MDKFFGNTEKVRQKHYINLKAVSDRQYAETLGAFWGGVGSAEDFISGCAPKNNPFFTILVNLRNTAGG